MNEKLASTSAVRRLKKLRQAKLLEDGRQGYSYSKGPLGPKLQAHLEGRAMARELAKRKADASGNRLQRFSRERGTEKMKRLLKNKDSGLRRFMREGGSYSPTFDIHVRGKKK